MQNKIQNKKRNGGRDGSDMREQKKAERSGRTQNNISKREKKKEEIKKGKKDGSDREEFRCSVGLSNTRPIDIRSVSFCCSPQPRREKEDKWKDTGR